MFPMDLRIPPLEIKILLESNPLKLNLSTSTEIGRTRASSQIPPMLFVDMLKVECNRSLTPVSVKKHSSGE